MRWFGQTHTGRVRKNNEDSFLGLCFDANEAHYLGKVGETSLSHLDLVFAVSDGMGGAMAGEFASKITVEKITRLLPKSYGLKAKGLEAGFPDVLAELFDQIHKALLFLGSSYEECRGMGATLSVCWFTPEWLYFAHIGDSRIYYLPGRERVIRQLTHDDTHVGWLYRNAKLSEYEARNHPRRNVLQKALGAGHQFVDPQVGSVALEPGDLYLICSDGVVDGLFDSSMLDLLRPTTPHPEGHNPAAELIERAVAQSGKDNATAIVVEVL